MDSKSHDTPSASANAATPPPAVAPPTAAGTLPEPPRRRGGGTKRKASALSSGPPKRQAKERSPLHLLFPVHNGPCTRARQTPNKQAAASASTVSQKHPQQSAALVSWSEDGGKEASTAAGLIKAEDEEMVEKPLMDVEFEAVRSRGSNVHAIPTTAGWFSWENIHFIEKQMLPSFFNGKSEKRTPEVYMEIRNSIMKKFHADPQTHVEHKDFSELSVGDMDTRQEVLEFLDHWGLINFHPFPKTKLDVIERNDGSKASSLIDQLYQFETVEFLPRAASKKEETSISSAKPSFFPESSLADDLVRPAGPSVEYHCNSCSADCSRRRYHCQKQADFDLCTDCYNDGKFGLGMMPADFILMESADIPGVSGGNWTDQETLLLLEALELFGQNWNEIAEHVATKTKAQCILHFLQMPIEDSFLEDIDDVNDNNQDNIDPASKQESANLNIPEATEVEKKEAEDKLNTADACETKDIESTGKVAEPLTSNIEFSVEKDSVDTEISHETGADIAIDVLKTAFQDVGYFPEEGLGSFAEAGNPVMALAAFLAGLVDPDVATTSCSNSLKAMSHDSPGIQLASRHCFLLGDPPNDNKDPPGCLSVGNEESHKDESQVPNSSDTDKSKECSDKNEYDNAASVEHEKTSYSLPKQIDAKQSIDVNDGIPNPIEDSIEKPLSNEHTLQANIKDTGDSSLTAVPTPSSVKDTKHLDSQGEGIENKKEVSDTKLGVEENPRMAKDSEDSVLTDKVQQHSDSSKSADALNTQVVVEQDCQHATGSGSIDETKENADEERKESISEKNINSEKVEEKELTSNNDKSCNSGGMNGDHHIDRLRRAAVTALSAAAVKARFLSRLEEDEIRRLVSLIIDKQLRKVEAKLTIFAEMENVILRMREQTDRAKQRLFHERSQIIAARLGLPPSSFRANPASLPPSRIGMGYGTSGPRPPMRRP